MEKRILGKELLVSAVGYGCMGLSHASGAPTERKEAVKILREAYDIGYTFFDTAECYTGEYPDGTISYNEELVGEAFRDRRDKVVIASKYGVKHGGDHLILDSSKETIRKSVEGSLKKLQTDVIDLYYQHRIDPKVSPEEVAEVMKELIKEGKIRYWGISETNEEYLRRAHAVCPVTAIENRYSMMARWHENLFSVVEELQIGYVAFSPMANGFLSGKYNENSSFDKKSDFRAHMPQYTGEGIKQNQELLELLYHMAKEKQATSAQISMAWIMCKKPWIVPIPGSRKLDRMKENAGAADIKLTEAEIKELDEILEKIPMSKVFGGH
ncbi:aldo/keto reductase [Clostridium sp. SHJSY1]|uniref:aldo/keto reductase n=1 Tax=Clostridium sp. SHJSY1 TaxID=2942483 RepID=UPI0028756D85|nr:aldo/keto reductase [Clostridium sp. SHJSY1]MDS0527451.1 aldo/keto reductase [Clostridium sp. SHJSY1]